MIEQVETKISFDNVNEAFEVLSVEDEIILTSIDPIALCDIKKVRPIYSRPNFHGQNRKRPWGVMIDLHQYSVYHYLFHNYVFWFKTEEEQKKCLAWFCEFHDEIAMNGDRTSSDMRYYEKLNRRGLLSDELLKKLEMPITKEVA